MSYPDAWSSNIQHSDNSDESDDDIDIVVAAACAAALCAAHFVLQRSRIPMHNSALTGASRYTSRRKVKRENEKKMSECGLNLQPQQKKQPTRGPLHTDLDFGNDDDDSGEQEISCHASKNKFLKDIEEQQRKALEEDPSAFDYDGVYDEMKAKAVEPKAQGCKERKPKYIQNLLKKAEPQQEQEAVFERKLTKERSKEDHLSADKDKFVTSAYKKKLAEQAKWMEEERLHQLREEKDDVTKNTDLSDLYFNLEENVASGAKYIEQRKPEKPAEESRKPEQHGDGATAEALDRTQSWNKSNLLAPAKELFLARKRAKEQ